MNKKILLTFSLVLFAWIISNAQTYLISDGGTVNTCTGTIYDSGGTGNYSSSEDYTITICSDNAAPIVLDFTTFNTESYDKLTIYDGFSTSSAVLVNGASGSSLLGETVTGSGNCLTLVWHSDGSVVYSGFAATISCAMQCQNFDVNIGTVTPAITNLDSMWIDICVGETIDFNVVGDYANNNTEYLQSDATTNFQWEIYDGEFNELTQGVGMTNFNYTFDEEGGYFLTIAATDNNGCSNQNFLQLRIRVSITPIFTGVNIVQDSVCVGEDVNLDGYGYVTPIEWSIPVQTEVSDTAFLPDGNDIEYTSSITYQIFEPGQTLDDVSDLFAICANMEHSYVGDLTVWMECPDGSTMEMFDTYNGTGSGQFLGEPVDYDSDIVPGVGYDYCWVQGASETFEDLLSDPPDYTFTDVSGNTYTNHSYVPSGDYAPTGDWSDLEGCPLNGTWTIHVFDNMGSDNGYIFYWQLYINPDLIPDDLWVYENEYDTTYTDLNTSVSWTGDNIISDIAGDGIAQPLTPGLAAYTLNATDDFGCTHDTTLYVFVRPIDDPACCTQPVADAGTDDQVCANNYVLHTNLDLPVNTVSWTQVSGPGTTDFQGTETSTDPTIVVDTYGIYVYQVSEENLNPSCSDTDQVEITFYETPTSTFSASTVQVPCYGDDITVTYIGTGSSTANYVWNFNGGNTTGIGQGPIDVVWNDPGIHEVTLNVTENGCSSSTTSESILTPEVLTYSLSYVDDPCFQSCNGEANIVVNGGTLPYTYSWGANNHIENLCAGSYSITVTDNNGCEVDDTYTIGEAPEIVVNSTSTQDISCFNQPDGEIHINVSGGTGLLSYNWSDGGSGADRLNMPAGNYSVTVSDINDCSIVEFFTLTQPDELLISISPDQALCEGQVTNINSQAVGGTLPYTYYWDSGNGYVQNSNVISVSPDTTTTYIVYVEDGHGCQSPSVSMTLTISPTMYMTLATEDNRCHNSCDGEAQLNIDGGISPFNYSWAASGSVFENLCSGLYTVTVTDIIGCSVDTVFFIDEPTQIFANTYTTDASCFGYDDGQVVVEAVGGVPGYSYLWPNGSQNDTVNVGAGTHEVTITDAHNCRLTMDAVVAEPDELYVQLVGGDRWICKTNTTELNSHATGGTPYYDFLWSGDDGSSYIVHNPEVTPDTTTTYTVTVVDSHGCSSNMPDVTVNVFPDLLIENISTSYDSICPRSKAIVEVNVSGGTGGPYYMTLQDGQVVPAPFTIYPTETTMYYVTLHDQCGSPAVTDSVKIVVMPEPGNSFVSNMVEGCPPLSIAFSEMTVDEGQTYLWNFGDNGFGYVKNPTHIYKEDGHYPVTLTVRSEFGCENTVTIEDMINVFPSPFADFYTDNEFVSLLDPEVQFFNISELADSSYWFFGDGDSSLFVNPSHNFDEVGEYEIHLIVESQNGCMDTAVKTINVRDEFTFYAPTAFTPNGDGENDFFMIYGNGIDPNEFTMIVYDRWGELIYETDVYDIDRPIEAAWDGTYQGNHTKGDMLLGNGVYYWYCKFKDYTGIWHEKEGNVSLIR